MAKRLKKYWRVGLVFGLLLVLVNLTIYLNRNLIISYVGMKVVAAQQVEMDPNKLTPDDFSDIPGVNQEYVDAYKIFLKAKASYKQSPTYADAVVAFSKIAESTKNPELKLRSLYMVTLSNFLQLKIDEAYKNSQEVLALSKQLYPKDSRLMKLEKVTTAIVKGEIKDIKSLKTELVEAPSEDFAEDLNVMAEGDEGYQKLKKILEAKKAEK